LEELLQTSREALAELAKPRRKPEVIKVVKATMPEVLLKEFLLEMEVVWQVAGGSRGEG
jgi:hypothetical protein